MNIYIYIYIYLLKIHELNQIENMLNLYKPVIVQHCVQSVGNSENCAVFELLPDRCLNQ